MASSLTPEEHEEVALRFGDAFEALFPFGIMRPRPTRCDTCGEAIDERRACYVVSDLPIARSYRIAAVYDRPACLPERYKRVGAQWDGQKWCTVDQESGVLLRAHALEVRALDGAEEAILLLAPHERENANIVATLRGFFEATPEELSSPEWLRVLDRTTLTFATGHRVSLAAFLSGHESHFNKKELGEETVDRWGATEERLACFSEESAIVLGETAR
ncbi:hypothetical protein EPN42_01520 [bacterium]|nr:MAG: hypothetical protein EPN42_01520 [bacterium]